jgi:hypothetical protein
MLEEQLKQESVSRVEAQLGKLIFPDPLALILEG